MSVNYYIVEQAYTPISYEGYNDAVVIIGYANKGPSMLPVYFENTDHIESVFGFGSELSNACLECFYAGAERVIAFRINGIYATVTLDGASSVHMMKLYAINAGDVGDTIKAEVATVGSDKLLTIYEANGLIEKTYFFGDMTINSLCAVINRDSSLGRVGVVAETIVDGAASLLVDTAVGGITLTGGVDEALVTGATLYERLSAIYSMLETLSFDILIPLPIRYTDYATVTTDVSHMPKDKLFYNQLADFCDVKADDGYPVTAIIAADDFVADTDVNMAGYVSNMESKVAGLSNIRPSRHVIVTRSWLTTPFRDNDGMVYISSGAPALGGLLNSFESHINPVNKSAGALLGIYNNGALKYGFDADQIKRLSDIGICAFHSSIRKGVCLASAITSVQSDHPCSPIKNNRLINYITRLVALTLDEYIGNAAVNQYSLINKAIESEMESLMADQIIRDYSYTVTSDHIGSNISIDIEVIPYNDIKTVSASIMVHL